MPRHNAAPDEAPVTINVREGGTPTHPPLIAHWHAKPLRWWRHPWHYLHGKRWISQ